MATATGAMTGPAAGSFARLSHECQDAILARLPPNCIPLAMRQLSKEWRRRFLQHTIVNPAGTTYLPCWACLAALPELSDHQTDQLMAALARRGDLEGMQQLAQRLGPCHDPDSDGGSELAFGEAASLGRLDIVRWLVEERLGCKELGLKSGGMYDAAEGGHIHVMEYLRGLEPPFEWSASTVATAASGGHLEAMRWLRDNGCIDEWTARCIAGAARGGHLHLVQTLRAEGCPWDAEVCSAAAEGGHLEVLQQLRAAGAPWDEYTMTRAAKEGHLHTVRWLHASGCPWSASATTRAAGEGKLDVLKYLIEHGCPTRTIPGLCVAAAYRGHKDVLLWLRGQGHEWTAELCAMAAETDNLQLLQWLREQDPPCPWDSSVMEECANKCNVQMMRWMRQQDPPCPWDSETVAALVSGWDTSKATQCLEYALSNGCPWQAADATRAARDPNLRHMQFSGVPEQAQHLVCDDWLTGG